MAKNGKIWPKIGKIYEHMAKNGENVREIILIILVQYGNIPRKFNGNLPRKYGPKYGHKYGTFTYLHI